MAHHSEETIKRVNKRSLLSFFVENRHVYGPVAVFMTRDTRPAPCNVNHVQTLGSHKINLDI